MSGMRHLFVGVAAVVGLGGCLLRDGVVAQNPTIVIRSVDDEVAEDRAVTLREALLDAANSDDPTTIHFSPDEFPPDDPKVIVLTSTMPPIGVRMVCPTWRP